MKEYGTVRKKEYRDAIERWESYYNELMSDFILVYDALRPFADAQIIVSEVGDEDRADWGLVASSTRTELCSALLDNNAKLLTVAHLRAARKALRG